MPSRTMVAIGAAALVALSPVAAQERGSRTTRDYVQAAGHSDAFEMLEADTALTQSTDPQVRAFAQQHVALLQKHLSELQRMTAAGGHHPRKTQS